MREGVSGFVVDDVAAAVRATERAVSLPRRRCRSYFEERFLARRMAADYLDVYRACLAGESNPESDLDVA
jgi:glycosyltransferase involved in cell wall biosynthesis